MTDHLKRRFDEVSVVPTPDRNLEGVRARRSRLRARNMVVSVISGATVLLAVAITVNVMSSGRNQEPTPRPASEDEDGSRSEALVRVETETVQIGDQPGQLAVEGDSVWVTTGLHRELLEIREGRITTRYEEGGGVGLDVSNGTAWVTSGGDGAEPDGRLIGIDLDSGAVEQRVEFPTDTPYGVDAAAGGVFVALRDAILVQHNPGGDEEMRMALATGLADVLVAHGAVWVSQPGGQNPRVWRVTLDGDNRNALPLLLTPEGKGSCPQGLAATRDAMWVADPCAAVLWKLDPGGRIIARIEDVGNKPVDVAAGPRFLFVSSFRHDRLVTLVDPGTDQPIAQVKVGAGPHSIVAQGEGAWVANSEGTSLTHIIPRTAERETDS